MNEIDKAAEIVKSGGIVIFPTDTAFGIGCAVDNIESIDRLFKIRERPEDKATPLLVDSLDMARKYADIDNLVEEKLINKYWPGALTIVVKANKNTVPALVRGNGENVGLRIPNQEVVLELIKKAGVAILGPSANFHQKNTPFEYSDLDPDLVKKVDFVLDGECLLKEASTVIDTTSSPWKILRQGAIKVEY